MGDKLQKPTNQKNLRKNANMHNFEQNISTWKRFPIRLELNVSSWKDMVLEWTLEPIVNRGWMRGVQTHEHQNIHIGVFKCLIRIFSGWS